ncbi:hypothetical protein MMC30_009425 [Trapelia coarctata]|nr:hypothetical protein [Trapelia coarctata]
MRSSILGALLLPALALALSPPHIPSYAPFTTLYATGSEIPTYNPPQPTPPPIVPSSQLAPSEPLPSKSPNPHFPAKHPLPGSLNEFIAHLKQSPLQADSPTLEQRQNGGLGGGVAGAAPVPPNQVSPITTVYLNGMLVIYTQVFAAVPDQGPTPMVGSIGMGTLTGTVGVVKTAQAKSVGWSVVREERWGWVWGVVVVGGWLVVW